MWKWCFGVYHNVQKPEWAHIESAFSIYANSSLMHHEPIIQHDTPHMILMPFLHHFIYFVLLVLQSILYCIVGLGWFYLATGEIIHILLDINFIHTLKFTAIMLKSVLFSLQTFLVKLSHCIKLQQSLIIVVVKWPLLMKFLYFL